MTALKKGEEWVPGGGPNCIGDEESFVSEVKQPGLLGRRMSLPPLLESWLSSQHPLEGKDSLAESAAGTYELVGTHDYESYKLEEAFADRSEVVDLTKELLTSWQRLAREESTSSELPVSESPKEEGGFLLAHRFSPAGEVDTKLESRKDPTQKESVDFPQVLGGAECPPHAFAEFQEAVGELASDPRIVKIILENEAVLRFSQTMEETLRQQTPSPPPPSGDHHDHSTAALPFSDKKSSGCLDTLVSILRGMVEGVKKIFEFAFTAVLQRTNMIFCNPWIKSCLKAAMLVITAIFVGRKGRKSASTYAGAVYTAVPHVKVC